MQYKINDPVCVKGKYVTNYGRIVDLVTNDVFPFKIIFQDGDYDAFNEEDLSPADPMQCLMVGDKLKSGGKFLTIEGVCGNAVFYEYVDGKGWNTTKNLIRDGFTLLSPQPQEDLVEKYANEIWNKITDLSGEKFSFPQGTFKAIREKLNQFKEEIK